MKNLLPTDAKERKDIPIATGALDYFPRALAEVARVSKAGNDQHNPGQPLHWSKGKSTDHADCIARHLIERGTRDSVDGTRHSAKLAWRALANLEMEIEAEAAGMPLREYIEKLKAGISVGVSPAPGKTEDGWTPWFGETDSAPPQLTPEDEVEVKFRDGFVCKDKVGIWQWRHIGNISDIVAYRVVSGR